MIETTLAGIFLLTFAVNVYGNALLRQLLAPIAFVVCLLIVVASSPTTYSMLGPFVATFFWATILARPVNARRAGPVLLRFGEPRAKTYLVMSLIAFVLTAIVVGDALGQPLDHVAQSRDSLYLAAGLFSFGAYGLATALMKPALRARGILNIDDFVAWEWIEAYGWRGVGDNTLVLALNVPARMFRHAGVPVSPADKEAVERVVAQRLPGKMRENRR